MADAAEEEINYVLPASFRVCLNTIVRVDEDLKSEKIRILPMGSRVTVDMIGRSKRRARITQPVKGWVSIKSSKNDVILKLVDKAEILATSASQASLDSVIKASDQALKQTGKDEEIPIKVGDIAKFGNNEMGVVRWLGTEEGQPKAIMEVQYLCGDISGKPHVPGGLGDKCAKWALQEELKVIRPMNMLQILHEMYVRSLGKIARVNQLEDFIKNKDMEVPSYPKGEE